MKKSVLFALVMFCSVLSSQAQTVNFSVNPDYTSTGPSADSGTDWNAIVLSGTTSNDVTSTGDPTDVTFTDSGLGQNDIDGTPSNGLLDWYGYTYNSSGLADTLNNVPDGTYDVYLVGQNGGTDSEGASFSVNGASAQTVQNDGDQTQVFINGANYTEFTDVTPVDGTITIDITSPNEANSAEADFNGVQLVTETPEPHTWALMFMGVLGTIVAIRRRRLNS